MLVAYALSAGNAGTAFRYRTHIVGLALCLMIVLRSPRKEQQEAEQQRLYEPRLLPPVERRAAVWTQLRARKPYLYWHMTHPVCRKARIAASPSTAVA